LLLYHACYVTQREAQLAGKAVQMPSDAEVMAEATRVSHESTVDKLVRPFRVAGERLQRFVHMLDPQELLLPMKPGSDVRTLDDCMLKVEQRIGSQYRKIARKRYGQ
jgi:hypothetical protein